MTRRKIVMTEWKVVACVSLLGLGVCMAMGLANAPQGTIGKPLSLAQQQTIRGGSCYIYDTNDCPTPPTINCPIGKANEEKDCPNVERKVTPHTDDRQLALGARGMDHSSPAEVEFCWRVHTCIFNPDLLICSDGVDTDWVLPQTDHLLDGNECNVE